MNDKDIERFDLKTLQGSCMGRSGETVMAKSEYGSYVYYHDYELKIKEVEEALNAVDEMIIDRDAYHKENEELKQQTLDTENALTGAITCIESMKCCGNCGHYSGVAFDGCNDGDDGICPNWKQRISE